MEDLDSIRLNWSWYKLLYLINHNSAKCLHNLFCFPNLEQLNSHFINFLPTPLLKNIYSDYNVNQLYNFKCLAMQLFLCIVSSARTLESPLGKICTLFSMTLSKESFP